MKLSITKIAYINVICFILFIIPIMCVKQEDFKKCDQSGFCTRQRAYGDLIEKTDSASPYNILSNTLIFEKSKGIIKADVINTEVNVLFNLEVILLTSGSVRVRFDEKENPLSKVRYDVSQIALENNEPAHVTDFNINNNGELLTVTFGKDNSMTLNIQFTPFKIDLIKDNESLISFNHRGYFNYEYHRVQSKETEETKSDENQPEEDNKDEDTDTDDEKSVDVETDDGIIEEMVEETENESENKKDDSVPAEPNKTTEPEKPAEPTISEQQKQINELKENIKKDMWSESFKKFTDSKPYGPESIGFDVSFKGFKNVYGLPEHSGPLNLKTTRNGDEYSEPYRLYNLDVFEYEIDNSMALYGSIPFLLANKKNYSSGILFINASEMWIDVEKDETSTHTHWMAESGRFDVLLFAGSNPKEIIKKYMDITGKPSMPQSFAIAYHQSRWNYIDETDVATVDENFDKYEIPYDVLWLDIEHTDGKRYYTWDNTKFPNPEEMQEKLAVKGRKMVTIVDPHIKVDDNYYVYKTAKDNDYFVHNKDDKLYDGWCWPGSSSWIDYLNKDAEKWASELFKFENYKGTTKTLYTWIDMNEPSVFSGPEVTMPKDNLHFGHIEHRDIHNIYGELYHKTAYNGQLIRSNSQDRPFILSRAFFIGTQRYGAIWTGDNDAEWSHLQASLPMLLSIGISGITFSGADVGGFFGNPNEELMSRWYQAAAFQPFFRGHSHIDTKRREPWLFSDTLVESVRSSINYRYVLLPQWYTLFREANLTGIPTMRPMFMEYPNDEATYGMEDQYMLGDSILVKPVVTEGQKEISVYLPKEDVWYNFQTSQFIKLDNEQTQYTMETPIDIIPVFIRGGSIITQRYRLRRSSSLMKHDPFTLTVALDRNGQSTGKLYIDDGETLKYLDGEYIARQFNYSNNVLSSSYDVYSPSTETAANPKHTVAKETTDQKVLTKLSQRIERVIILGNESNNLSKIKSVELLIDGKLVKTLHFEISEQGIVIKDPAVQIKDTNWKIEMKF